MKRETIINDYNSGTRFFQHLNLNNLSFKGQDFTDVIFSNCQCKSTNFSQVNLNNTKFLEVETGLSNFWFFILIILIFLVTCFQGFLLFCFSLFTMYLQSATSILTSYLFYLSCLAIVFITIFTPYIKRNFFVKLFNLPILFFFISAFCGGVSGYKTFSSLIVLAFLGGINGLGIGFLIISLAITFTVIKLSLNNISLIVAIILNILISVGITNFFAINLILTLIFSIYMIGLALYLAHDSIKAKSKSWLYHLAIFIIAYKSTKFYQSNLTNVNFEKTNLDYLDLRKANLVNTNLDDFDKTKLLLSD